jgi:hypothetical protein
VAEKLDVGSIKPNWFDEKQSGLQNVNLQVGSVICYGDSGVEVRNVQV